MAELLSEKEIKALLLDAHRSEAVSILNKAATASGTTRIRLLEQALEHVVSASRYQPHEVTQIVEAKNG